MLGLGFVELLPEPVVLGLGFVERLPEPVLLGLGFVELQAEPVLLQLRRASGLVELLFELILAALLFGDPLLEPDDLLLGFEAGGIQLIELRLHFVCALVCRGRTGFEGDQPLLALFQLRLQCLQLPLVFARALSRLLRRELCERGLQLDDPALGLLSLLRVERLGRSRELQIRERDLDHRKRVGSDRQGARERQKPLRLFCAAGQERRVDTHVTRIGRAKVGDRITHEWGLAEHVHFLEVLAHGIEEIVVADRCLGIYGRRDQALSDVRVSSSDERDTAPR